MQTADKIKGNAQKIDLDRFPRVNFCHRPTPIESMPRLSEHLGGPKLFVKRDDCTGLATGGNKTRKLEFLVGEALSQNADVLVTQGAVQSNHVRQTAMRCWSDASPASDRFTSAPATYSSIACSARRSSFAKAAST